jgi:exosome complex exonuclease RRP6
MEPSDDKNTLTALQDNVLASLVKTTKITNRIPTNDLSFHRSLDPSLAKKFDEQESRLLRLAGGLSKSAVLGSDLAAPLLTDADDLENNWRGVVEVFDSLLEKADTCLDEYTGVIKRRAPEDQTDVCALYDLMMRSMFNC